MTNGAALQQDRPPLIQKYFSIFCCTRTSKERGKTYVMSWPNLHVRWHLSTEYIYPSIIDSYVNCRLIPLNKCPGVGQQCLLFGLTHDVAKSIFFLSFGNFCFIIFR